MNIPKCSLLYFIISFFTLIPPTFSQNISGGPHGEDEFYINWKRYYNYDEWTDILKRLAQHYPDLATLHSTGKSLQGHTLWLMEIGNPRTGKLSQKPAIYIDGNIHGNEINGMMVPLYTIWYLLTRYGEDKFVTDLIDTTTFYIKPSVNPDAANSFVNDPNTMHHPRWNYRPVDNDGDGLYDEDPEEDINGDGEISYMRRRNPNGRYKIGSDPRLLVRVDDDEPPGGWEFLGTEGIDNDGDGRINEDIPGGVDLARNFPSDWRLKLGPPYPLSEPETKASVDFLLTHRNVAAIQHYHNYGKLIMFRIGRVSRRQPKESPFAKKQSFKSSADELMENIRNVIVPPYRLADYSVYRVLLRRGVEITNYRPTPAGGVGQFVAWGYDHFGAFTFLVELWNMPKDYNGDGKVSQEERLRWLDDELHGEGWVDWKPFKHPTLGDIEIGGSFKKFVRRSPPGRFLEEQCLKHTLWSLYIASNLPRVKISNLKVEPVDVSDFTAKASTETKDGKLVINIKRKEVNKRYLVWVSATVRNVGLMPTSTQQANRIKVAVPDKVSIELGDNANLVMHDEKHQKYIFRKDTAYIFGQKQIELDRLPGHSKRILKWLVSIERGHDASAEVSVISEKGGRDSRVIEINVNRN